MNPQERVTLDEMRKLLKIGVADDEGTPKGKAKLEDDGSVVIYENTLKALDHEAKSALGDRVYVDGEDVETGIVSAMW